MADQTEHTVFTVGHSSRSADDLCAVLAAQAVAGVVDVRSWPSSKPHPQFNRKVLQADRQDASIEYAWEKALGGQRRSQSGDEVHTAVPEPALRAYVEHLHGPEAGAAIGRLLVTAMDQPTAVLCAERDPQRCQRRLLADRLVLLHGVFVVHIIDETKSFAHRLSQPVRVEGERLVYTGPEQLRLV